MSTKPALSSGIAASNTVNSAIYGGGPIYKDGTTSVANLKASGFTEVIVWNIAVDSAGDLNFNYEFPLVANGNYVGDATHPDFRSNMASIKTAPSSVARLTFSIGSSNQGVFQAIQALISAQGTGPDSILYKNFQALKTTFPDLDAIDFDDENCYDTASMVCFAVMFGSLGFDVSLCPYENNDFWIRVASSANQERPGTVTAVHLQCYDGGNTNSPCSGWDFGPVPVYPGLAATTSSPAQVQEAMSGWQETCAISGGFIWDFDYFYPNDLEGTKLYANAVAEGISEDLRKRSL